MVCEADKVLQSIRNDLAVVVSTLDLYEGSRVTCADATQVPDALAQLAQRARVRLFQALERLDSVAGEATLDEVPAADKAVEAERRQDRSDALG
ncbi:MAG TPA: hypothetical protein VHL09_16635 [Dehalococcoidia bacterium]|nr:hypothetical protein [Dehalococcoidia bacterium]